jgi:filamentous hemagglutinin family protein
MSIHSRFALKGLVASLMLAFGSNVMALPAGGAVSAGSASIAGDASKMTITQSSQNAAINWQSFGIGASEAVQFVQPNSSSVALNRVLGADPSSILGSLSANGKVFLVNPNGILFGKGAQVNVGSLVASTLNITDANFMAGKYKFEGNGNGTVLNQGSINADGGYVALLGANVSNEGLISANLGTVALAAGSAMTLDVAGDGLLNVAVDQGAMNAMVQNGGLIKADGGQVLLTAQAAGNLFNTVVNNTGVIQAQAIENRNGVIRLLGDMQSGTVTVSGTVDASGRRQEQSGGNVIVTGRHVALVDQASIDVAGDTGGGKVMVGGEFQGKGIDVPSAQAVFVGKDVVINADAVSKGDGGKVIVWSDNATRYYGNITARGGAQAGDGGFVEVSGKNYLDFGGQADLFAPAGNSGTLLLDPANIIIQLANPDVNGDGVVGDDLASPNLLFNDFPGLTSTITSAAILNQLVTANVSLQATNNINVNTTIAFGTASRILTMTARNDVVVDAAMTATGTNSGFRINAQNGFLRVNQAISTTAAGGVIDLNAGNNAVINAALSGSGAGSLINVTSLQDVVAVGAIDVSGANSVLNLIASGNVNATGALVTSGATTTLRVIADNDGTGPGPLAGTVALGAVTASGSLIIRFNPLNYLVGQVAAEIAAYRAAPRTFPAGSDDVKAWVFGLGQNKVYDGTRVANVAGLKPFAGVAPVAVMGPVTNSFFDTKHVGVNKPISYETTFVNATYDLFAPVGFPANTYQTRADITARPLTVSAVTDTRVYNGTTSSVGVPTITGLQIGDAPIDTLGGGLGQSYVSKNVMGAGGSTLTPNGVGVVNDGNGGNNYTVTVNTAPGTITPLALIGSITAANKVYDGTNTATITSRTLATPIAGDVVTYVGGTATFNDRNVAIGKPVAGIGFALAGADAANYTVNPTANTTANITPAPLTIRANDNTKVYGTLFTPAGTAFTVPVAPIPGETVVSVTEVSPAGSPVTAAVPGPYAITPSNAAANGLFDPNNYIITYVNGALTVTPAPLTVTAGDVSKMFGQTPALTAFSTAGLVNNETVGSVTETSPGQVATATAEGSPYPITPSNAIGGTFTPTNYAITYVNGRLTVTPIPIPAVVPPIETTPISGSSLPISGSSLPDTTGGTSSSGLPAAFAAPLAVMDGGIRTPPQLLALTPPPSPPVIVREAPVPTRAIGQVPPVEPPPVITPPPVERRALPPRLPPKPDRN